VDFSSYAIALPPFRNLAGASFAGYANSSYYRDRIAPEGIQSNESDVRANFMIDQPTITEAIRLLLEASPAGSRVILFGSYARGDARQDSDLDFLIVEPRLSSRRSEMVRLRQVLRPMQIPVDVLVVSESAFESWKDTPNNVIFAAFKEGRVFTHAA